MNFYRCTPDRSLDRTFLRHCAVRRLFEHGCVSADRAAELLLCKKDIRRAVVESWTDLAGDPA
jgi:hypothetical protein